MLLSSAMNMFAFKFILVIKCSIIINERKKKHCHFGGCYIWRHLIIQSVAYTIFFLFHIYKVGFETNSNKMDNENQSKNQKKKEKKKNRKQEEIPKFNRAFYFFYLCLPSSSERLFRFLMKQILVTPLAN